ncbi:synaptic plasticity regulator PANTS [Anoplolepis gracilipes]|uniref:synaptic plasticity regulator PANTS n=1 Tax=Anoplolepis gracilipes TaxID=354296 RepID=UPI003BA0B159
MSKAEEEKVNHEDRWMVRPCMIYKAEYDDCSSIRARFNQYFIFGETLDCSQWKADYVNCYEWEKNKSEKAYEQLIASEKQRRKERLRAHYENDVWEKRQRPPENWNAPLPEWMRKEFENSYLHIRNQEMKQNKEISQLDSRCTIL